MFGRYFLEKKFVVYFAGKALNSIITLLSIAFFIKWFGEKNYGEFVLIYAIFLFFLSGFIGWINQSVVKFHEEFKLKGQDIFIDAESITLKTGLLAGLILCAFLYVTSQIDLLTAFLIYIGFVFACLHASKLIEIQTKFNATRYSIAEVIRLSIYLLLAFILFYFTDAQANHILFSAILVSFLFGYLYLSKGRLPKFDIFDLKSVDKKLLFSFLKYGIPLSIWMMFSPGINAADRYMLNYRLGDVELAQYSVIYDVIFKMFALFSKPLISIMLPVVMKHHARGNVVEYGKVIRKTSIYMTIVFVCGFAGVLIFDDFIITSYLGFKDPEVISKLKFIIIPLVISTFIWQLAIVFQRKLEAEGKTVLLALLIIVITIISVGTAWFILPLYGYTSMAIITVGSSMLYLFLVLLSLKFRRN